MKGMDLFCSSPASTAICAGLDHRSMVRRGHSRPIDRQNSKSYAPCSSQLPHSPKPYQEKSRRSSAMESDLYRKSFPDGRESSTKQRDLRRKSSASITDLRSPSSSSRQLLTDGPYIDWISECDYHASALVPVRHEETGYKDSNEFPVRKSSSSAHARKLVLESDHRTSLVPTQTAKPMLDSPVRKSYSSAHTRKLVMESDHRTAVDPTQTAKPMHRVPDDSLVLKSSSSARSHDQVVVLRVSIHCKGCEGKVRKHISKMEGVTSYSIDLATKKVTVIGDVTPLGVLASLSKVKNAQLWPSPAVSSSSPSPAPRWST